MPRPVMAARAGFRAYWKPVDDKPNNLRAVDIEAWDEEGYALVHDGRGRLMRAADLPGFTSTDRDTVGLDDSQYVPAAPGWRVQQFDEDGALLRSEQVAMWRVSNDSYPYPNRDDFGGHATWASPMVRAREMTPSCEMLYDFTNAEADPDRRIVIVPPGE